MVVGLGDMFEINIVHIITSEQNLILKYTISCQTSDKMSESLIWSTEICKLLKQYDHIIQNFFFAKSFVADMILSNLKKINQSRKKYPSFVFVFRI